MTLRRALIFLAAVSLATACEANDNRHEPGSDAPGADNTGKGASGDAGPFGDDVAPDIPDDFDFGNMSEKAKISLHSVLERYEGHANWPARPRRAVTISDSYNNRFTLGAGIKYNMFGDELENTVSTKFHLGYDQSIMLIRTAPTGMEQILMEDDEGNLVLNYEEGVDFVAICSWSTSTVSGVEWTGKLAILGNGVKDSTEISRTIETNLSGYFYDIVEGDTIPLLRERCNSEFEGDVKESLITEQKLFIRALLGIDGDAPDTPIALAAKAARTGPTLKDVAYQGETFNVHQASKTVDGAEYTVAGKVVQHEKLLDAVPLPGKDIDYRFVFKNGNVIDKQIDGASDESTAAELVQILAENVYLYARDEV